MFYLTFYKQSILKCRPLLFYKLNRYKNSLCLWDNELTTEDKLKIEKHWANDVLYYGNEAKINFYVLPMFPYPSGNLHMGHVRVYSISDAISRFHKLKGKEVIHPIGWDAFGLPAENAAIEHNILPHIWTNSNISTMKEQLIQLGFNFNWNRELSTSDPKYYKWTQYIFIKLYENGLAYQNKAKVNWDPIDGTVLADEQVDDNGCSWRSGAKVEKKVLKQWYIKTTKYAKRLFDGLNSKNLENWKDIINLQKHWIGECNGIVINFITKEGKILDIWSSEPYKFIHGEYITISKSNILFQEITKEEIKNLKFYNPITDRELNVYIADHEYYPEGRDAYIACPTYDEKDNKLSALLNIKSSVQKQTYDLNVESDKVIKIAQNKNCGGYYVSSKLKDWLISRQRYWGTPIPIIHCPECGTVPVPYNELPVLLPQKKKNESKISTLLHLKSWSTCACPQCKGDARRETDTMDTFVDSSWYYYRFLDHDNEQLPFDKEKLIGVTPVDCYIGGKEHAVLHLYYARFMSYFLYSIGLTPTEEPFKKLLVQGLIMGQSYKVKSSGKYLPIEKVEIHGDEYVEKFTSEPVMVQWEKMSKSKHNGENPQRLLSTYGCDTTRLLILADVPPETSRQWSDNTLPGVLNWQHRLWITIREFLRHRSTYDEGNYTKLSSKEFEAIESKLRSSRNYFIATASYHFNYTQKLSVGISRLQSLTNVLRNKIPAEVIVKSQEYELSLAYLVIMLSPITPHFCSELWAGLQSAPNRICHNIKINWDKGVLNQNWPNVDENYPLSFQCKVDGADRCELKIEARELRNLSSEEALQMMLNEKAVKDKIRKGINRTKYELYPDCRAILHIYTNRHTKNKLKEETEAQSSKE